MNESAPRIEKDPTEEAAETALLEMGKEMEAFLSELNITEKSIGDDEVEVKVQIENLRNKAKFTAEWWVGNILAFAGTSQEIAFPAIRQAEQAHFEDTRDGLVARARKELAEDGITAEQRKIYKPVVNDLLHKGITPVGYGENILEKIRQLVPNLIFKTYEGMFKPRFDAWRIYLGIAQRYGTFGISDHIPGDELGKYRITGVEYCYKLNNFWKKYLGEDFTERKEKMKELIYGVTHGGWALC